MLLAEVAEPGEQMRIAAQVRKLEQERELGLQEREEAADGQTVGLHGTGSQGGREMLKRSLKKLLEYMRRRRRGPLAPGSRQRGEIGGKNEAGLQAIAKRS